MPRQTGKKKSFTTFYVVYEGDVEDVYFKKLKGVVRGLTLVPKKSKHSDPATVLKTAIDAEQNKEYKQVWAVYDGDVLELSDPKGTVKNKLDDLKKSLRRTQIAMSYPAFEVWLLSHFKVPAASYPNQDKVIEDLRKFISGYDKSTKNLERGLFSCIAGKCGNAISNASALNAKKSSSKTNVVGLITEICRAHFGLNWESESLY